MGLQIIVADPFVIYRPLKEQCRFNKKDNSFNIKDFKLHDHSSVSTYLTLLVEHTYYFIINRIDTECFYFALPEVC